MTRLRHPLLHVVPGPAQHGVARHGLGLQQHLEAAHGQGVELLRCARLDNLEDGALAGRVAVVQVTDRLVAGDAEAAVLTWRRLTAGVARLTVVLHDLPQRSDGRSRTARSRLYAALATSADGVVVASRHERLLLAAVLRWACPRQAETVLSRTQVIPLPVERAAAPDRAARLPDQPDEPDQPGEPDHGVRTVVTLGFVYPGKGLEEVVDAAALAARDPRLAGVRIEVRNLGRASEGHEDLVEQLRARATAAGVAWSTSGWVDDADLPRLLGIHASTVPVAAHRHFSASGSVATWLAAGRRPLVLTSRYGEELAGRLPGTVRLVPPLDLARALADALADPATTVLAHGTPLGPSWAQAASALHEMATRPAVSVVVPYYRDQQLLDLLLARLRAQTGVVGDLEVIVADDGSPEPPDVGAGPGVSLGGLDNLDGLDADTGAVRSVRVVRQHRDGFRAAAARNLGARHSHGRVLCFLDGDTVPEDTYVAALQGTCLRAPALALGRRRHGHLTGAWPPPPGEELPEPAWLDQGYRASDHLRAADDGSFRFVISAVMALSRPVWDATGGFDEGLTGYGGEDWELAWRCWLAGADLRHVPDAVAWHDGPDLAGRAEQVAAVKNAETVRLSPLLPHPLVRGRGWTHPQPDVVAVVRARGWTPGQVVVVLEALLRLGDVGVWVEPSALPAEVADPRVHPGRPGASVLARARATIEVARPVAVARVPWSAYPLDLTGTVALPGTPLVDHDTSGVRVTARRHEGRHQLHGEPMPPTWLPQDWVEPVPPEVVVERWRQGRAVG